LRLLRSLRFVRFVRCIGWKPRFSVVGWRQRTPPVVSANIKFSSSLLVRGAVYLLQARHSRGMSSLLQPLSSLCVHFALMTQ